MILAAAPPTNNYPLPAVYTKANQIMKKAVISLKADSYKVLVCEKIDAKDARCTYTIIVPRPKAAKKKQLCIGELYLRKAKTVLLRVNAVGCVLA